MLLEVNQERKSALVFASLVSHSWKSCRLPPRRLVGQRSTTPRLREQCCVYSWSRDIAKYITLLSAGNSSGTEISKAFLPAEVEKEENKQMFKVAINLL